MTITKTLILTGMVMLLTTPAWANTQPLQPIHDRTESYCSGDIKPDIPKGTLNKQQIGEVDCLRQRISPYQSAANPVLVRYHAHKAHAWLAYAAHEVSEKSTSQAYEYALGEAATILAALQQHQADSLTMNADMPSFSGLQRPDLWSTILAVKQTPAFDSLVKDMANSEVKLIWAEAEYCESGWRHAREHFSAAHRWVTSIDLAARNHSGVDISQYQTIKSAYRQHFENDRKPQVCEGYRMPSSSILPGDDK